MRRPGWAGSPPRGQRRGERGEGAGLRRRAERALARRQAVPDVDGRDHARRRHRRHGDDGADDAGRLGTPPPQRAQRQDHARQRSADQREDDEAHDRTGDQSCGEPARGARPRARQRCRRAQPLTPRRPDRRRQHEEQQEAAGRERHDVPGLRAVAQPHHAARSRREQEGLLPAVERDGPQRPAVQRRGPPGRGVLVHLQVRGRSLADRHAAGLLAPAPCAGRAHGRARRGLGARQRGALRGPDERRAGEGQGLPRRVAGRVEAVGSGGEREAATRRTRRTRRAERDDDRLLREQRLQCAGGGREVAASVDGELRALAAGQLERGAGVGRLRLQVAQGREGGLGQPERQRHLASGDRLVGVDLLDLREGDGDPVGAQRSERHLAVAADRRGAVSRRAADPDGQRRGRQPPGGPQVQLGEGPLSLPGVAELRCGPGRGDPAVEGGRLDQVGALVLRQVRDGGTGGDGEAAARRQLLDQRVQGRSGNGHGGELGVEGVGRVQGELAGERGLRALRAEQPGRADGALEGEGDAALAVRRRVVRGGQVPGHLDAGDGHLADARAEAAREGPARGRDGQGEAAGRPGRDGQVLRRTVPAERVGHGAAVGPDRQPTDERPQRAVGQQPQGQRGGQVDGVVEVDAQPLADGAARAALGPGRSGVAVEGVDGVVLRGLEQPGAVARRRHRGRSGDHGGGLVPAQVEGHRELLRRLAAGAVGAVGRVRASRRVGVGDVVAHEPEGGVGAAQAVGHHQRAADGRVAAGGGGLAAQQHGPAVAEPAAGSVGRAAELQQVLRTAAQPQRPRDGEDAEGRLGLERGGVGLEDLDGRIAVVEGDDLQRRVAAYRRRRDHRTEGGDHVEAGLQQRLAVGGGVDVVELAGVEVVAQHDVADAGAGQVGGQARLVGAGREGLLGGVEVALHTCAAVGDEGALGPRGLGVGLERVVGGAAPGVVAVRGGGFEEAAPVPAVVGEEGGGLLPVVGHGRERAALERPRRQVGDGAADQRGGEHERGHGHEDPAGRGESAAEQVGDAEDERKRQQGLELVDAVERLAGPAQQRLQLVVERAAEGAPVHGHDADRAYAERPAQPTGLGHVAACQPAEPEGGERGAPGHRPPGGGQHPARTEGGCAEVEVVEPVAGSAQRLGGGHGGRGGVRGLDVGEEVEAVPAEQQQRQPPPRGHQRNGQQPPAEQPPSARRPLTGQQIEQRRGQHGEDGDGVDAAHAQHGEGRARRAAQRRGPFAGAFDERHDHPGQQGHRQDGRGGGPDDRGQRGPQRVGERAREPGRGGADAEPFGEPDDAPEGGGDDQRHPQPLGDPRRQPEPLEDQVERAHREGVADRLVLQAAEAALGAPQVSELAEEAAGRQHHVGLGVEDDPARRLDEQGCQDDGPQAHEPAPAGSSAGAGSGEPLPRPRPAWTGAPGFGCGRGAGGHRTAHLGGTHRASSSPLDARRWSGSGSSVRRVPAAARPTAGAPPALAVLTGRQ